MMPLCVWAWLMHYVDLSFNIMPVLHPERLSVRNGSGCRCGCLAFMGGVLAKVFPEEIRQRAAVSRSKIRGSSRRWGFIHPVADADFRR